jgi:hypothetical protein
MADDKDTEEPGARAASDNDAPLSESSESLAPELTDIQDRTNLYYRSRDAFTTNIYGPINTGHFTIGSGDADEIQTGIVDDEAVRQILEYFTPPPAHDEAATVLAEHRFVVLSGNEHTGRRCGAFALLSRLAGNSIVAFAPNCEFADLLGHPYKRNTRYVVTDCSPEDVSDERLQFDLGELRKKITADGAYLVATTTAPAARFGDFAVNWSAVSCVDVLDTYLREIDRRCDYVTVSRLRDIAQKRRPDEMRKFFARLEEGSSDAVEQYFQDGQKAELRNTIGQRPDASVLLPLVAAAFFPGARQGRYEFHLDRLREQVDEHARRDPATRDYCESLAQSREERAKWVGTQAHPSLPAERTVELIGSDLGEVLLIELQRLYGRELWKPVDDWLCERPREISGIDDERPLAAGLATFARVNPVNAYAILDSWVDGPAFNGRLVAAATVSALCEDASTLGDAVHHAAQWSGGTPKRKVAAALAFGQALGGLYPIEATSYLWFLSLDGAVVSRLARNQLVALVRASCRDSDKAVQRALWIMEWQLEQVMQDRVYRSGRIDRAIETVSAVLQAEIKTDESFTLRVLRRLPDQVGRLGALWAAVLRNWALRGSALEHLHATYEALGPDGSEPFAALGAVVRQHVDAAEWQWLCRDLACDAWTATHLTEVTA